MAKPTASKRERNRRIRQIAREYEAKKRALGLKAPALKKGPVFYLVVLIGFLLLGSSLIQMSGKADAIGLGGRKVRDGRPVKARKSVDAVAEALGRFKFHTGVYPSVEEGGIEALAVKYSDHAGWIGPYLHKDNPYRKIAIDPWKRGYVYEPPKGTNTLPTVLSLGADGVRGTADDILPDPALFTKAFRDTTWTNDWVPFTQRGIIVVPSKR
ncbi:MAG: type II secretion system protein GspG [Kiritimatiellae bacterium]|nr:type II secretion system protein GspG [Kiritimatiellia bacterium]